MNLDKENPEAPAEPPEDDALWEAMGSVPKVPVDPYFAQRVTRIAADTPRRTPFLAALFGSARGRLATLATAGAAAAVAFVALRDPGTGTSPLQTEFAAHSPAPAEPQETHFDYRVAAVEYVDYMDQIVAAEDPSLLSDEDILALLLDDGSSALLF